MEQSEFDRFADEYRSLHAKNIRASGEGPDFFAEYKIRDVVGLMSCSQQSTEPLKILDFGAGTGNSIPYFAKYFPSAKLTCVDVSKKSIEIAAERFPGMAEYTLFDGRSLPFFEQEFDLVFTACVFHHIPEAMHRPLFEEIRRVMRDDGRFVIFEHNPRNPLTRIAVDACPFDENAVLIDADTLAGRVKSAGFKQVTSKYRIFFPRIFKFLRSLEQRMGRIPFGAQYYVTAKKN
jgi:ubiquinone/menaquinone biosynthesis C-methylase UbiE